MDTGEPSCHPVVQGKNDPTPGYYVSMTSLYDASITSERDPAACGCSEYPVRGAPPKGFNHAQPEDLPPWSICKMAIRPARALLRDQSAPDLPMGDRPWRLRLKS